MSREVKIGSVLFQAATQAASSRCRLVGEQIEHWARIGKMVEENPGVPYSVIKRVLASREGEDDGQLI
jgi:hypothetical protein